MGYGSAVNYNTAYCKAAYKYIFKAFYNKTNNKESDLQIRQHNIQNTNIIAMKNMVTVARKWKKNEEQLAIINLPDKTAIAKSVKISIIMDLDDKYG